MNLKDFDLNLISIFEALYEERNQSRAAERLGISQPAVSHALNRLRATLNDHLFHDRVMTPTAMAHDLYSQFHQGLNQIRSGVRESERFDPASSHRHFTLAASYSGGAIYGPELYRRLKQDAPAIRLSLRTIDPASLIPDLLRQRNIDMAICHAHTHDTTLVSSPLREHMLTLLARSNHPKLSQLRTLDDLWTLDFAAVHGEYMNYDATGHDLLSQLRQERVMLEVPTAMLLMSALIHSDLVCVTIQEVAKFAMRHFDLEMYSLPTEINPITVHLVWHRSLEWDTANQWLRQHVRDCWAEKTVMG